MPKIKLMSGGGFPERDVESTTVGQLRRELDIPDNATVSVGGTGVTDSHEIQENDIIAAVTSDKKGG